MSNARNPFRGRLLVVAFEGWNDAGEAASSAVTTLQEQLDVIPLHTVDPETYYDFQFNRPTIGFDDEGNRALTWPTSIVYAPMVPAELDLSVSEDLLLDVTGANANNIYLLQGVEPRRN